jgi:hypothetical protein
MQTALVTLIERFREAQDRGVAFILNVLDPTLGVKLPAGPLDWIAICGETGLYNVRWLNGVDVYAHGYGIELVIDGVTIDFDWGERGEPDGFDVWRLWIFARLNPSVVTCPEHAQVGEWIEEAAAAGELVQDRYLYYSPHHRARRLPTEPKTEAERRCHRWFASVERA